MNDYKNMNKQQKEPRKEQKLEKEQRQEQQKVTPHPSKASSKLPSTSKQKTAKTASTQPVVPNASVKKSQPASQMTLTQLTK